MAGDFRRIERELARFFEYQGWPACRAGGELYIGARSPHVEEQKEGDGARFVIAIDSEATTGIISLSDLARELAEFVA